jgi:hypothetical protein
MGWPQAMTGATAKTIARIRAFMVFFNFGLGHLLSCKLIALAIVNLDTKSRHKVQYLVNTLHEQLPMTLAIVLLKGIARKSFTHVKKMFNQPSANNAC